MKMTMIVADSNVIVSALLDWHQFNPRALPAINRALADDVLILPQHVLIESYSVMTRLPAPRRVLPQQAFGLLHETFGSCHIISMSAEHTWQFVRERDDRTSGGALYDALIAVTAIQAGANRLLTFNPKHFAAFADQIEIVVPT
jgi:predicted nucleic acid-binding protein